jgi:hypothetical protein
MVTSDPEKNQYYFQEFEMNFYLFVPPTHYQRLGPLELKTSSTEFLGEHPIEIIPPIPQINSHAMITTPLLKYRERNMFATTLASINQLIKKRPIETILPSENHFEYYQQL